VDVNEGVAFWFYGFSDKLQSGLLGCSATFFNVAFGAGTNNVAPDSFSAHAFRDNVVERKLAGWIALAAILAVVFITGENVSAIEFDFTARQTVVE